LPGGTRAMAIGRPCGLERTNGACLRGSSIGWGSQVGRRQRESGMQGPGFAKLAVPWTGPPSPPAAGANHLSRTQRNPQPGATGPGKASSVQAPPMYAGTGTSSGVVGPPRETNRHWQIRQLRGN